MVEITFIRHGETVGNAKGILGGRIDFDLTEKGVKEAEGLNLNTCFDEFYCSPLKRTHQTLNAIYPNQDFNIDERITEVYSGDWQGKYKNELPNKEYNL